MLIDLTPIIDRITALEQRITQLEAENEELRNQARPTFEWVTIKEAAEILQVHAATVHRHCQSGDLKKYRDPKGNPRLKRDEVEGYYSRRTV